MKNFYFVVFTVWTLLLGSENAIAEIQNTTKNKALGIFNACQEYYEIKNKSFWSSITSSDRNIVEGIKDGYALCDQQLGNLVNYSVEEIASLLKRVRSEAISKEMLAFINKEFLRTLLRAFLATRLEYGDKIDNEKTLDLIRDEYPNMKGALLNIAREEVIIFNRAQNSFDSEKRIEEGVASLKHLGEEVNKFCQKIQHEYKKDKHKMGKSHSYNGMVSTNETPYERNFYKIKQEKMALFVGDFKKRNIHSKLFVTKFFKKKIFSFDEKFSKRCATEKDIDFFNLEIASEDIKKMSGEFQELMLSELKSVEKGEIALSKGGKKVLTQVENILKYRPFLIGGYLDQFPNGSQALEDTAKYLCNTILDIYSGDEFRNKAEIAVAGVSILASIGAFLIPGVGPYISPNIISTVGLTTSAAGAIAESGIELSFFLDSQRMQKGVTASFARGEVSNERLEYVTKKAETQKNWAIFGGALSFLSAGRTSLSLGKKAIVASSPRTPAPGRFTRWIHAQDILQKPRAMLIDAKVSAAIKSKSRASLKNLIFDISAAEFNPQVIEKTVIKLIDASVELKDWGLFKDISKQILSSPNAIEMERAMEKMVDAVEKLGNPMFLRVLLRDIFLRPHFKGEGMEKILEKSIEAARKSNETFFLRALVSDFLPSAHAAGMRKGITEKIIATSIEMREPRILEEITSGILLSKSSSPEMIGIAEQAMRSSIGLKSLAPPFSRAVMEQIQLSSHGKRRLADIAKKHSANEDWRRSFPEIFGKSRSSAWSYEGYDDSQAFDFKKNPITMGIEVEAEMPKKTTRRKLINRLSHTVRNNDPPVELDLSNAKKVDAPEVIYTQEGKKFGKSRSVASSYEGYDDSQAFNFKKNPTTMGIEVEAEMPKKTTRRKLINRLSHTVRNNDPPVELDLSNAKKVDALEVIYTQEGKK